MKYYPQKEAGKPYKSYTGYNKSYTYHSSPSGKEIINKSGERHPKTVLRFNVEQTGLHPTQKPVPLFEYLIKTYTNEEELVLDNCMGSFTTAVACINTKRNYIGFEMDNTYFELGQKRLDDLQSTIK